MFAISADILCAITVISFSYSFNASSGPSGISGWDATALVSSPLGWLVVLARIFSSRGGSISTCVRFLLAGCARAANGMTANSDTVMTIDRVFIVLLLLLAIDAHVGMLYVRTW